MKPLMPTIVRLIVAVATLCAGVSAAQAQGVTGSADAGQKKAEMCMGCHVKGYQVAFPELHKVPKIAGQSEKYIVSALSAYKKGERKHPSMRGISASLSDQDMADLAAFYAKQGGQAPGEAPQAATGAAAALIQKGACASCHGANFAKPIDPSYPKLAGQHPDYLYVALKSYTVEGNHLVGRSNGVMGGVAKQFKPAEMRELANYLGSLNSDLEISSPPRFR